MIIAFLNYKEDEKVYLLNMSRDLFQINKLIVMIVSAKRYHHSA